MWLRVLHQSHPLFDAPLDGRLSGILGIYGLIVAAILVGKIAAPVAVGQNAYSGFAGFAHLAAGLACGLSSLSAGMGTGRLVWLFVWQGGGDEILLGWFVVLAVAADPTRMLVCAGLAIGVVGDAGVRAVGQQPQLYVGMILILIFGEALGLYGLIVALILSQKGTDVKCQ